MEVAKDVHGVGQEIIKDEISTLDDSPRILAELRLVLSQIRVMSQRCYSAFKLFEQSRRSRWIIRRDVLPDGNKILFGLRGSDQRKHAATKLAMSDVEL